MIGQEYTKKLLTELINNNRLPRFIIIVGNPGCGKKTYANCIATEFKKHFNGNSYILPDIKIASIRELITNAYMQKTEMLYILTDIDNMSVEAQNAILKITEEPPNKAYFIMTVSDIELLLTTIKSRAYTLWMDNYTADNIHEYALSTGKLSETIITNFVINICETPGEVNTFIECGAEKFYDFVSKVVDNTDNVTIANLLKVTNSLDLKGDGNGYDVTMFLKVFMRCCMIKGATNEDYREAYQYIRMIPPTSKALSQLRVRGANKNMILTDWLFSVRS